MCGRYGLTKTQGLKNRYSLENEIDMDDNFNVAPSQIMPVIIDDNGKNKVEEMRWGLVPFWSKTPTIKFSTINARAETVTSSSVYRDPFKKHRCLIPATGFYEWKKLTDSKIPYFIHVKSEEIFSLAGLFDIWKDVEGKEFPSYTIITTKPNKIMEDIHNRMPVILPKDEEQIWLDSKTTPTELENLLIPYSDEDMEAYTVSTAVNSPRNNNAELLKPFSYS
jgi:putative SOS response-associated peptidase YedK